MKIMKKRILAMVCTLILLGGTILQVMPKQIVDAADKIQAREWDIIKSTDTPLTVINTTEGSIVKAGSKSNCNINLPENISEGNLALYMKLNVDADESALELLNTAKNTYVELCNEKSDERERNWEIGSQYGLSNGENELMLRFDASGYHHGTDGKMPFDYRETINFFRLYTGNSNNSYTTDMRCKVEVTELRVVYTDAGLDFGQNGDDTYLQLSDELSENPTTIEASIKKEAPETQVTEWTLIDEQTITCTGGRLSWGGKFDVTILEEVIERLAISFTIQAETALSITEGQLEITDKGMRDDTNEIRVNFGGKQLSVGANEFRFPLKDFVRGESANINLAKLDYIWFYTQSGVSGTFKLSDVKLYVMPEKEWGQVYTAGKDTNSEFTVGTDEVNGESISYDEVQLSAGKFQVVKDNIGLEIPEKHQTLSTNLANSNLAFAFWFYTSDNVTFSDAQFRVFDNHFSSGDCSSRYMLRELKTLHAGWHYIVLPLSSFWAVDIAEYTISSIKKIQFYSTGMTGTYRISDICLVTTDDNDDSQWKIAAGYIKDSSRESGDLYSYKGVTATMGIVQPDEEGPKNGTVYAEASLSNKQLLFARTLINPIPEAYKLNSVEDRASSKLAVAFWLYSSTDTILNDGQVEFTSSSGRNDNHEIRFNTGKHPITLSSGWNYIVMPFSQFDYTDDSTKEGTLDLSNLNYMYFYDNTVRSQEIRIADIYMLDLESETVCESQYTKNDSYEMIFSNTGNGDENQTALFVTNEGYPAYVEGDKQYTLEQNVCTGDWVDLAVVRDTNKIVFYIDGVQAGFCSVSARTNAVPYTKHSIGADGIGEQVFNGSICDVRVWKDVRTANEIKDNLVDKSAVTLTSNNLDMTDSSLLGSWLLVGDIQYVLETMPDNAGGNHAVFCGSRANDWSDYQIPEELGKDYWSMVFIPDIQNLMTGKYTRMWYDMTDWIAANIEKENIKHVIGAGDSSWSNLSTEYRYAKNGFDKFTDSVSWSNMIGNHDYKWNQFKRDSSEYNNAFGKEYINSTYARFTYAGSMEDEYQVSGTENSYYTFTVNGVHWMILQLEYYPRQNVLTWADNVIKSHPNYNVILTTHSYLNGDGTYTNDYMDYTADDAKCGGVLGTTTEAIWNQIVAPNANVKMILCGHSTNGQGAVATKTLKNNAGNDVTALMMNVQDLDMNEGSIESAYYTGQGLGAVNILRFSADGSKVALQQFAPEYQKSFGTSSNAIQLDVQTQALDAVVEKCEKATAGVEPDKKPGYVFAGWFLDENCTEPLDAGQKEVEAYAKYVDEEIFSVKAQVSLLKDGETDLSRDIRFVTTVDSLQYSEVGFAITMKNKTKIVGNDEPYVYERLLALDDRNKVLTYEPNVAFSTKSAYFKAFTIRKIPYTAYESERITVRAYWKTFDGTKVYGKAVTKSIQDYLQLKNTGNLDKATLYGRSVIDSAGELNLFWTNSGLAFCFNGTGATAKMKSSSITNQAVTDNNCSYVEVYLDDASEVYKTICLNEDKEYVLAEKLSAGEHKIELRKRNEAWGGNSLLVNIQSIDITGGKFLQQPAVAERNIEVIGDSITCGHGNLVTDGAGSFSTGTEDGTDTYAVIAGKKLGAEVSVIARSGIGYCRGTSTGSMYDYYTKTAALPNNVSDDSEWNFTENKKDVVVINLGTNDSNAKVAEEYMKTEAIAFLELVREKNPDATIIWAYGMMGSKGATSIQEAVEQRNQDGDKAVYYLSLTEMDTETEGTGIGNHPTTASHQKNADVLAKFIAEKTGWQV